MTTVASNVARFKQTLRMVANFDDAADVKMPITATRNVRPIIGVTTRRSVVIQAQSQLSTSEGLRSGKILTTGLSA